MKKKSPETEIDDSWTRFERAVDAAVKSGPKHRPSPPKKPKPSDASSSAKKQKPVS